MHLLNEFKMLSSCSSIWSSHSSILSSNLILSNPTYKYGKYYTRIRIYRSWYIVNMDATHFILLIISKQSNNGFIAHVWRSLFSSHPWVRCSFFHLCQLLIIVLILKIITIRWYPIECIRIWIIEKKMCLFPILPYFCVSVHPIKCSMCGFNQSEINIKIEKAKQKWLFKYPLYFCQYS